MGLRFPAMKPPEVNQALQARLDKVKNIVEGQVDKRGCDAPDIRQLVQNFETVSKRP